MMNSDIQDLLRDILDDMKPLPSPAKVTVDVATNKAKGHAGDVAFDMPDTFLESLSPGVTESVRDLGDPAYTPKVTKNVTDIKAELAKAIDSGDTSIETIAKAADEMAEAKGVFTDTEDRNTIKIKMPVFTSAELAESMDIRNFATLVTLNTARWHAKVKDRKAAEYASTAANADKHAFETRKRLLVGADEKLKAIHKAIDEARAQHYSMTLPWTTTGVDDAGRRTGGRLLPNTLFFEYTQEMARHRQIMLDALDDFVPEYPNLVAIAQTKLGSRFDPTEYPNSADIRSHFRLSFDFQPVPAGTDFKGLPQQQLDTLARHLNANAQKMTENAMQEVWTRLRDAVARMADRLSSPDKLFHYTLVDNVRDVSRLLAHLNITNDAKVEALRKKVERHLCLVDAKQLRDDPAVRRKVGAHAASILSEMDA